ncbi:hypothetical protein LNP26_25695 [Klebsiella variicola subsp. variicola]|nr:hypothetical protein [Klebsiella variicola subsp. variicola]
MAFYRGEREGERYPVQDDAEWLARYQTLWARHRDRQVSTRELVTAVLSVEAHWEQDLSQIPGLVGAGDCRPRCYPVSRYARCCTALVLIADVIHPAAAGF